MITEDYVSFEVAKLLKEKGFDEPCYRYYSNKGDISGKYINPNIPFNYSSAPYYLCPSQSMAMKWLREKHNLCIEIFVTWRDKIPHYQWRINNLITQDTIVDTPCLEKLEEAVEAALKYTLKNLI